MNTRRGTGLLVALVCVVGLLSGAEKSPGTQTAGLAKTAGTPNKTYLNINNISTVFWNNGYTDIDVQDNNSGFTFPKGSNRQAIFKSGFLWGGKVGGETRVGGSAYRTGLQGGKILSTGVAEDPELPKNRIYRVRPDIGPDYDRNNPPSVASELADREGSADQILAQYVTDWQEWPATDGAPFDDKNGNGTYEPDADVPGVQGADQTIWYVANDLSSANTTYLYGSNPIGLELQVTAWAYSLQGALGNMNFRRFLLINRSVSTIDSMYVSQWADPDLGNSADDYVGCDTTLSLGYVYNANATDATYDPLPPPAAGFDFFQGPIVAAPGDSAIFQGKIIYGYRNLPMTAFYYFARGDLTVTDPTQGTYEGTEQFYNFMRGRIGKTGAPFVDPNTGLVTTFVLAGDPQGRRGWYDGQVLPADDRRMGSASGPFTMAPGDTQEVVVAAIAAGAIEGTDRLSCIGLLKFYDQQAQIAYNNFFNLPVPPPAARMTVTPFDREVVISWGDDAATVAATEGSNSKGYTFQGYNVYQLPAAAATIDQAKRLATFDVVDGVGKIKDLYFDPVTGEVLETVVQFGNDTGIKRSFRATTDELTGGNTLINGIRYYFAVTAYNFNPDPLAVPNNLETPLQILTVVPQSNDPGVRYTFLGGDTVQPVTHTGPSDGSVTPMVINPNKLNGHTYEVTFADVAGQVLWTLTDKTDNRVVLADQTNQSGDDNYQFVDGLQVIVAGPPPGMKDWDIPSGTRRFTWAGGADGFHMEGFSGAMGNGLDNWGVGVPYDQLRNVVLRLAGTDTLGNLLDPNDPDASFGYRYLRGAQSAPAKPEFAPFFVNTSGSYAYQDYTKSVPLAAYNMETDPPTRLMLGYVENNAADATVDGKWWPPDYNTGDNTAGAGPREWLFIFAVPYSETPDPTLQINILDATEMPIMWFSTAARRGDVAFAADDEFLIEANHINTLNDVFTFTATAPSFDQDLAKTDVSAINVFPNPYYGVNTQEVNKYQRFVTFNHLPAKATIRIFNLAGILVRTINKDTPSQFERWDLSNESGLPAGSGLYIVHIDMPEIGATKILKVAVVQEQQILDRF